MALSLGSLATLHGARVPHHLTALILMLEQARLRRRASQPFFTTRPESLMMDPDQAALPIPRMLIPGHSACWTVALSGLRSRRLKGRNTVKRGFTHLSFLVQSFRTPRLAHGMGWYGCIREACFVLWVWYMGIKYPDVAFVGCQWSSRG